MSKDSKDITSKQDIKSSALGVSTLDLFLPSTKSTILVLGIYVFFLAFGFFQESVFKVGSKPDSFRFPMFLVAVLCFGNAILAAIIFYFEMQWNFKGSKNQQRPSFLQHALANLDKEAFRDVALSSITYVASMLSTNYALTHVNYPTQVLVKSAKCVPVILGGLIVFGKRFPLHDYIVVSAVTTALIVFNFSTSKSNGTTSHQTFLGLVLLGLSLFCDALTGPRQDHLLSRIKISSVQLMMFTNIFGTVLSTLAVVLFEGYEPIRFCLKYPEVISHIFLFCCSAALGQFFIFASLTEFGSLYLTLITTTRKFFTVLLSVLVFGHHVSPLQWVCVATIFASLAAQSYSSRMLKMRAKTQ